MPKREEAPIRISRASLDLNMIGALASRMGFRPSRIEAEFEI